MIQFDTHVFPDYQHSAYRTVFDMLTKAFGITLYLFDTHCRWQVDRNRLDIEKKLRMIERHLRRA